MRALDAAVRPWRMPASSPTSPVTRRCRCRCGGTTDGLPIGVHFLGRFGDEATLFRLAAQLERPGRGQPEDRRSTRAEPGDQQRTGQKGRRLASTSTTPSATPPPASRSVVRVMAAVTAAGDPARVRRPQERGLPGHERRRHRRAAPVGETTAGHRTHDPTPGAATFTQPPREENAASRSASLAASAPTDSTPVGRPGRSGRRRRGCPPRPPRRRHEPARGRPRRRGPGSTLSTARACSMSRRRRRAPALGQHTRPQVAGPASRSG